MNYPKEITKIIKHGGVGAMPTDTIFGLVASAHDQKAVERVYAIKGRGYVKPFIVLISDASQLTSLGVTIDMEVITKLIEIWNDPVSVVLPCPEPGLHYLHRGKLSLAVRLPKDTALRNFISETGPIIATSANKSGQPSLNSLQQIRHQLPDLDFYIDGTASNQASRLARLRQDNSIEWLTRG